jgi:hypothetical protein
MRSKLKPPLPLGEGEGGVDYADLDAAMLTVDALNLFGHGTVALNIWADLE